MLITVSIVLMSPATPTGGTANYIHLLLPSSTPGTYGTSKLLILKPSKLPTLQRHIIDANNCTFVLTIIL
jgi:hypothetical protein